MVGAALRQIHDAPEQPWTVRAGPPPPPRLAPTLARRFTDLVGETPMAYLASWRLALAADMLREPDATVGAVATQVGYASRTR